MAGVAPRAASVFLSFFPSPLPRAPLPVAWPSHGHDATFRTAYKNP